eukprot:PITA_28094
MGPQGLYLNKWAPDFDPTQDIPSAVPVWVRLPHLPLHCWNQKSFQIIGNALGKYIDQAARKDQYSCARICVEVDLEEGLPEAIKLTVAGWSYVQELDYEQLPFKCKHCHSHGHFAKNCKKRAEEQAEKQNGEQWTLVQKNASSKKKGNGKGSTEEVPSPSKANQETEVNPKDVEKDQANQAILSQENEEQEDTSIPNKEVEEVIQREINLGSPLNPTYAEIIKKKPIESSSSSEDEVYERQSKKAGRKSRKEKREEEAERLKTQGSQATIEMTIGRNTRPRTSKGGPTPSSKAVNSRGTSGGLATLWNDDLFQLDNHKETQHWIQTELMHKASKLNINLFNLYVPVSYQEKRECWSSLSAYLEQTSPSNIIIAGDLNIIMKAKEKRGGTNNRDPMLNQVEELFQRWDLLDFNPIRGIFTWTNNRLGSDHISARLDRFMVQGSIMMKKKIIITKILAKLASDHKPIQLLLEDEKDLGPIPFRFSPLWIEKEGFEETIKAAWGKPVLGSPSYVWEQKLKATKLALKNWVKKTVHPPTEQRKESVQAIQNLQTEMENIDITADLLEKETKAQCSAHHTFRKEEEYWRLKSRSLWLKTGDRNTSYFHRQYKARVIRNHIAEIKTPEGRVCNSYHQIKAAAENYFRNLYRKENHSNDEEIVDFMTNIPKLISYEENAELCRPATEEEITKVVWAMDADKAPGPDGFSVHFYKACWQIIKLDLFKMISRFMEKAKVGGGTNSTYLALIPKESNPETFSRFRPISLCNTSYKILAKLIANRIKPLLNKLISPSQGGFVEGRNITDNVIHVQEIIHSSKRRKEKGMLVKLDMASTFDKVDHTFICKVLMAFGFSQQFINLIKACIGNPWIAPLVNGASHELLSSAEGHQTGMPPIPVTVYPHGRVAKPKTCRRKNKRQHSGP